MPGYRSSWRHFQNINLANTPLRDDALASNAYYGHGAAIDYRNRTAPHAITIVGRDAFAGARRTGEQQHAGDWQHLQDQARAPAIDPSRASVLGAPSTPHVPVGPWPGRPRAIAPDDARPDEHSTARVPNGPRHWSGPHATGDDASTPPDVPAAVIGLPGFTPADESAAPPAVAPSTPVPGPAPYDRSRGHHNSRIGVTVPPTNEVGGDASSVRVGVPSSVDAPIGVRPSPVPTASPSIPNDRAMGRGGPGLQAPAVETPAPAPAETIEPELPDSVRWQIENR
jgi:hypothetical protein